MKGPEPWKDEEAMETDLQTLLSMYLINTKRLYLLIIFSIMKMIINLWVWILANFQIKWEIFLPLSFSSGIGMFTGS